MTSLVEYFETDYLGRPVGRHRRRREPPFPIALWNQYQRTIDVQGRTNNYTEAWNKAFQVLTGGPNRRLWKVITSLKMDSTSTRKTIMGMEMDQ